MMIASWKQHAIQGMARTFSGVGEANKVNGEAALDRLHAKIGQLVVERSIRVNDPGS
jgi:transposase